MLNNYSNNNDCWNIDSHVLFIVMKYCYNIIEVKKYKKMCTINGGNGYEICIIYSYMHFMNRLMKVARKLAISA